MYTLIKPNTLFLKGGLSLTQYNNTGNTGDTAQITPQQQDSATLHRRRRTTKHVATMQKSDTVPERYEQGTRDLAFFCCLV